MQRFLTYMVRLLGLTVTRVILRALVAFVLACAIIFVIGVVSALFGVIYPVDTLAFLLGVSFLVLFCIFLVTTWR